MSRCTRSSIGGHGSTYYERSHPGGDGHARKVTVRLQRCVRGHRQVPQGRRLWDPWSRRSGVSGTKVRPRSCFESHDLPRPLHARVIEVVAVCLRSGNRRGKDGGHRGGKVPELRQSQVAAWLNRRDQFQVDTDLLRWKPGKSAVVDGGVSSSGLARLSPGVQGDARWPL